MTNNPFAPAVAGPVSSINERVRTGGHYLIVVGVPGGIRVSCPDCGLGVTLYGRQEGDVDARDLVDRALARFPDKSCGGVKLHLLAEAVMES